ncbi:MAG TPA: cytochrome P460 family protein [Candidatus Elarobacter sp.]|nr:cytochrome P460 family protein [Candidatus Elarobacter sp.]
MRWLLIVAILVLVALGARAQVPPALAQAPPAPTVTVPPDYRNWPYASASLALSYPSEETHLNALARAHLPPATAPRRPSAMTANAAGPSPSPAPAFQNVFVSPAAYASFQKTGLYPDKTVFVLEVRASVARQSKFLSDGLYQGDIVALRMEVRDDARYPKTKWAWFTFAQDPAGGWRIAPPAPEPLANCWQCHVTHGAVQDSFTQFYPTLFAIAKAHGTVKPAYAR